jgi:pyruvate formate lyase activating enzyme
MKEAMFCRSGSKGEVVCGLCPHECRIPEDRTGLCGVRKNQGGSLISLVYGKAIAANADPIEKKPLFHFLPGTLSFSIATVGCNLSCKHCQNADISQMPVDRGRIAGGWLPPEKVVFQALAEGCSSISFTYTEPTVYYEYAYDTARLAVGAGLQNVFVTNGYIQAEPLQALQPWLNAANVDLKSFRDRFYREVCRAKLQPVLDTLSLIKRLGIWLEVTTLLIPGWNDEEEELRDLAGFLRELDPEIPWHVSAFHPTYRMTDRNRTTVSALRKAREIGLDEGLMFVYTGNVPGDEGEHTFCPKCGRCVIRRQGFRILEMNLKENRCGACGQTLPLRRGGAEGPGEAPSGRG